MITRKVKLESLIPSDSLRSYQSPNSKCFIASASRSPTCSTKSVPKNPKKPKIVNSKPSDLKEIQYPLQTPHNHSPSGNHPNTMFQPSKRLKSKKPKENLYKKYNIDSLQLIERILSSAAKKTHYETYAASLVKSAAQSPNNQLKTNYKKKPKIRRKKLRRKSETPYEEIPVAPLVILKGEVVTKAPKLYKNQLFADVYDKMGNHDRVLDTSDCKDYDVIYTESKPSIQGIIKQPPRCMNSINTQDILNITSELINVASLKPPENSYIEDSTKETPNNIAKYSQKMDIIPASTSAFG